MKKQSNTLFLAQSAMIAAIYVVLTVILAPFSYGEVQVRVSEALTIFPVFTPAAIPGLFVGCLISNILGGCILPDIIFGSIATLLGACFTYLLRNRNKFLAPLPPIISNILIVPFFKQVALPLGVVGFLVLSYLTIVGTSNAVNLTDGLDGLAAFPVVLVAAGLAIFAYASGHSQFAQYLQLPYVAGANEVVIFCTAMCGACLGFLWFNAYPAQVFMGDVGALALLCRLQVG